MTRPKYFTRREVSLHNQEDNLWVILFQKVLDLSPLCQKSAGQERIFALLAFGGKDISHLFDTDGQVKCHVNPETNKIDAFSPFQNFIDLPSQGQVEEIYLKRRLQDEIMANELMERFALQRLNKTNSDFINTKVTKDLKLSDEYLPWWKDEQYVIGLLTTKSRWITIRNMLTGKAVFLEVCSEETIDEILLRYLKFNSHARSYTWKYMGQNLLMSETLETNGIPDRDFKAEKLRLNDEDYIPTIDLYFNDDLTDA
ncbi:Cytochrome b5 domain-containing protein 1 [Araneus ventricosus]|uniref:Cytochrome b5 domain-containing protein 1 n=1 Tax=Araneus ventricosus TaxID=182803 RepID=A0A4Y2T7K0_ARAVE|nr:Cytochrome b5 domain-containing protein 1 [Araneus ventricosus]